MMKNIQNVDLKNKRVLLRVDFNVPVENGKIKESFKIKACQETVQHLLIKGAKVGILSHLGRPQGEIKPEFSLGLIRQEIENILGVKVGFVGNCIGEKVRTEMLKLRGNDVMLLENVRFFAGEEGNDLNFAKQLAENFDIFVNDAFSVCHRDQASVTGVAKILPSYAGIWLQKELENLDRIKNSPEHPAVAIIGGAKIETKLPLISNFERNYDHILVGGMIANEAIDQKISFSEKVSLPEDFSGDRLDIGPATIKNYVAKILKAKTIIWNGPLGKFEIPPYDTGTKAILRAVMNSGAFSLMGGGESVQLLEEQNALDKISFVSTGGGAMLAYLSGNKMPGIDILN